MARFRNYSDKTDVLQAACQRLRRAFETHDTVGVCFSGGKDSTVVLHLTRMIAAEYGVERIPVVFRDEEVIPDNVVDFVAGYRGLPWVDLRWYAVPLQSSRMVFGATIPYVQWDPARAGSWVRQPPPWAIRLPDGDSRVFSQYAMDAFAAETLPGKVCLLTGVRAEESILRLRSCLAKLREPEITSSATPRVSIGRPIYDWEEADIFKFLHDHEVPYCGIYDAELLARHRLRVATPITSEGSKELSKLRAIDPDFYDRVRAAFPGTEAQERYWRDIDRDGAVALYAVDGFDGIARWIDDNVPPESHGKAVLALEKTRRRASTSPHLYEPAYVLKEFIAGAWKRGNINPLPAGGRR